MVGKKAATEQKYQVKVSDNALRNINEITGYITFINGEPYNAIKVGDAIFATIARIEQHPFAFRECDELKTKRKIYRRAICLSWLVIYRVVQTDILVLGVMHASRKPSATKILREIR
jgi:plasmid stabilization system protein ParE